LQDPAKIFGDIARITVLNLWQVFGDLLKILSGFSSSKATSSLSLHTSCLFLQTCGGSNREKKTPFTEGTYQAVLFFFFAICSTVQGDCKEIPSFQFVD